ncbi:Hpt domain-containing protein [Alteromonas sp. H39]|uniref:Hpt domain-containing protein n=1 Tax=Alteromonas sp. H39 TaxID=3389876 RepID=UPI0039DF9E60
MTQAITLIDLEFGISQLSGNKALLLTLLNKFSDEYRQTDDKMQQYFSQRDFTAARTYIHTLKGVAGNLGLSALFHACKALDDALKQTDAVPEHYPAFVVILSDTLDAIAHLDDSPASTTEKQSDESDAAAKAALINALNANEFIPQTQLDDWLNAIFKDASVRDTVREHIDELDYQSALTVLEA